MIGIYKIISPTGKIYIGQSIDLVKRRKGYGKHRCKTQPKLLNSLKKYGFEAHTFQVIFEGETESLLNEKERYYQDLFDVTGKNGLNCLLTATETKSGQVSEETKRKLREARKGRKPSLGHKHSDSTKRRISDSHKGKKFSDEHKMKIGKANKNKSSTPRLKQSEAQIKAWIERKKNPKKYNNHSLETKRKMSVARKEYWRNKKSNNE